MVGNVREWRLLFLSNAKTSFFFFLLQDLECINPIFLADLFLLLHRITLTPFGYTKFETNDHQLILKCDISEITKIAATSMKKSSLLFFDELAIHLKKKRRRNLQLVQNSTKQYNTNTETAYTAQQTFQNEISKSASSRRQGPLTATILKYRTPNTPKDIIFSYFEQNCSNCFDHSLFRK